MHNKDASDDGDIEEFYSVYCDLFNIAREWLTAGAALELDDILASVTVLERLDTVIDMDIIQGYVPLVTGEPTVQSVVDEARALLHEYFTQHHLPEPVLRQLRDRLRSLVNDLQKAAGALESHISDIADIQECIAMRKQLHAVSGIQKRIRSFANMMSSLRELRWESTFSTTRVQVTPKPGVKCQLLQSAVIQLEIPQAVGIEAVIADKYLTIIFEGLVRLSVAGRQDITDFDVSSVVIDKIQGTTIMGLDRKIMLTRNGSHTDVQVEKTF